MAQASDQDLLPWVRGRVPFLMSRIEQSPDCWLWRGALGTNGYGIVSTGTRSLRAHRAVWMAHYGKPIPDGMTLDHRCRNRLCVNPRHLEPVSFAENLRRGAIAREGGATIRERITSKGITRFAVTFREEVDGKVRQRSRTFGSRETAEQFRQQLIDRRFTTLPASVWEEAAG